jgi:hypothetical protein
VLQREHASKRELRWEPKADTHLRIVHGLKSNDIARALQHPAAARGITPRMVAKSPTSRKTKCPERIEPCYRELETAPTFSVGLMLHEPDLISDQGRKRLDE